MASDELILGIFIGLLIGASIAMILIPINMPDNVDKVIDNQRDCQIKEYYYMDSHRDFCDRIGVKP